MEMFSGCADSLERGCVPSTSRSSLDGLKVPYDSNPFDMAEPLRLGLCPQPRSFGCGCGALSSLLGIE
jgi:hypothetical protein